MKKLTALLCTAAMTLGMAASAFANPSITVVSTEQMKVSEETAAKLPEGKTVEVVEVDLDRYKNLEGVDAKVIEKVTEVVDRLNDDKKEITMSEILEIMEVDTTKEIKTTGENPKVIDPTEYEPINKFADLVLTDGTTVEYDVDGEVVEVTATLIVEDLKDVEDIENFLIMQIDPKTGEVYFIEIDKESYDPETGEITVTFPCLGPFTILEKTAAAE